MEKNLKKNVYILNHFVVYQKLTQHCKTTILQLKKRNAIIWPHTRRAKSETLGVGPSHLVFSQVP